VRVFAICLACDRKGGRSLAPAWRSLVLAFVVLIVVLAAFAAFFVWLSH
jgi:hypothetical protein